MRVCLAGVGGRGCGHGYVGSPGKSEWKGPAAQKGGGTIRKSPWMATVFGAKDGRLATGATVETSDAERGRAGRKMLDGGRAGGSCSREGGALVRSHAARLLDGRRDRPTRWMERRPRAYPHIYRKKKEKKNRRRNGTGSAGLRMKVSKNAEVPRRKCGGWWGRGGRPRARPGRSRGPPGINSPPALAPLSAPDHCPPPPANTRPPGPPRGTDRRPADGLSDVETASL